MSEQNKDNIEVQSGIPVRPETAKNKETYTNQQQVEGQGQVEGTPADQVAVDHNTAVINANSQEESQTKTVNENTQEQEKQEQPTTTTTTSNPQEQTESQTQTQTQTVTAESEIKIGDKIFILSLKEKEDGTSPAPGPAPGPTTLYPVKLEAGKITANSSDGTNHPSNVADNDDSTRYSGRAASETTPAVLTIPFSKSIPIARIELNFYREADRTEIYKVGYKREDGTFVYSDKVERANGTHILAFPEPITTNTLQFQGFGNVYPDGKKDLWFSVTSVRVFSTEQDNTVEPGPNPNPEPTPGGELDHQGFKKIFPDGGQKRVFDKIRINGEQGGQSGIRHNITLPDDLINYEVTFEAKCNKINQADNMRGAIKVGSHGQESENSELYGLGFWYNGEIKGVEYEGPHMSYAKCNGWEKMGDMKPIVAGDIFRLKATRRTNSRQVEVCLYQDKNLDNNWTKLIHFVDGPSSKCGSKRVSVGKIVHEGNAHVQATLRLNRMDSDPIKANAREIIGYPE